MTRHLYDLERLMDHSYGNEAFKNKELFETIVEHRKKYTPLREISYDLHAPETLNIIPPYEVFSLWEQDYKTMQENMFYGESLDFEELMKRIKKLNEKLKTK
jgi:hypothetical protein